jgi:hypothetical protein
MLRSCAHTSFKSSRLLGCSSPLAASLDTGWSSILESASRSVSWAEGSNAQRAAKASPRLERRSESLSSPGLSKLQRPSRWRRQLSLYPGNRGRRPLDRVKDRSAFRRTDQESLDWWRFGLCDGHASDREVGQPPRSNDPKPRCSKQEVGLLCTRSHVSTKISYKPYQGSTFP